GLDDVRALFHEVLAHGNRAGVRDAERVAGCDDAPCAFADVVAYARDGGFPQHRAIDFTGAKIGRDHFDRLIQYLRGLDLGFLDHEAQKAVRTAALRRRDDFAVEPLDRLVRRFELGRIGPHHHDVAALALRHAGIGHEIDRRHAALGGRDDRWHVAEITDLLLVGEHLVHDDGALQRGL